MVPQLLVYDGGGGGKLEGKLFQGAASPDLHHDEGEWPSVGACVLLCVTECVLLYVGDCVLLCVGECVLLCVAECVLLCVGDCVLLCVGECVLLCVGECVHFRGNAGERSRS